MSDYPPGRYERLVDRRLRLAIRDLERSLQLAGMDPAEAPGALVRFLAPHLERALSAAGKHGQDGEAQWALANRILELLHETGAVDQDDLLDAAREELRAVGRSRGGLGEAASDFPPEPTVPLSVSELLMNAQGEPRLANVLEREIESADHVDLLCSFLKWSGFRVLRDAFAEIRARHGRVRVLTTAYCGATEARVLDALTELGAEVRVSLDTRRTRLHAKAWLLHRDSGYSTAFIGSSNLSSAAMLDGLEWNVRLSAIENEAILERFEAAFEGYWSEGEFRPWSHPIVRRRFEESVRAERGEGQALGVSALTGLDLRPHAFQQEILERLDVARRVHDRHWNLVVAATGTGKTIIAAFDYARLCRAAQDARPGSPRPRLLFVAHRKELLEQARMTFRAVLKSTDFGEMMVDGAQPVQGDHVFASVQSLASDRSRGRALDSYQVVIVDEFHHAEAPSYRSVLDRVRPEELLGLTATPERTDGNWVQDTFFDGKITAELRLWDALELGFLCPFQYFGVADPTDLSGLSWRQGYAVSELEAVYNGNDARAMLVHQQVQDKIADPERMRAIGFCVSVDHARAMAQRFTQLGYRAACLSGETARDERRHTLDRLQSGELQIVFAVDLLNEGVDLPRVDTLLLLRPTQSGIIFQQQLGRGLRHADGKECLTVLDFIGQSHRNYAWAPIFQVMTGGSSRWVETQVKEGFPNLPPGCSIQLDRQAREHVLRNIRAQTRDPWESLTRELRKSGKETSLSDFIESGQAQIGDVYRKPGRTWRALRARAGWGDPPEPTRPWKAVSRLRDVDDPELIRIWSELIGDLERFDDPACLRPAGMLAATLLTDQKASAVSRLRDVLREDSSLRAELRELFPALAATVDHLPIPWEARPEIPLRIHCRYSLGQALAAFGIQHRIQAGVHFDKPTGCDLFFVTLRKSEKHYSPRTMYRDYAISPELFHWESQHSTRADSPTGRRYQCRRPAESRPLLFVRNSIKQDGFTSPYLFAGPLEYRGHRGERPMQVTWALDQALPADWFRVARVAAG